ncbi:MAG: hypothetical protein Q7V63_07235 [Gammaproteobacteria bacterium]|nr:hypothetical protein [Gammaproteobacteria bacterium]
MQKRKGSQANKKSNGVLSSGISEEHIAHIRNLFNQIEKTSINPRSTLPDTSASPINAGAGPIRELTGIIPVVLVKSDEVKPTSVDPITGEETKFKMTLNELTALLIEKTTNVREAISSGKITLECFDDLTAHIEAYAAIFARENEALKKENESFKIENQALKADAFAYEVDFRAKLTALQTKLQTFQHMEAQKNGVISGLTKERDSIKSSLSKLSSEAEELNAALTAVRAENAKLTLNLAGSSARVNKAEGSLGEERTKNKELRSQLADITKKRDDALREVSVFAAKLEAQKHGYETSLSELKTSISSSDAEIASLKVKLEHAPWQTLVKAMEESLKLQIEANERASKAEEKLEAIRTELKVMREEALHSHTIQGRILNDLGPIRGGIDATYQGVGNLHSHLAFYARSVPSAPSTDSMASTNPG